MKKLLLILTSIVIGFLAYNTFASSISFGCSGMNCFLAGVRDAGKAIGETGVVTGKGISQSVQDFIKYLLSFLSLIAVIYVMYAGAQLLFNPADEESTAKTKKIIIGVISGIVIIWFAWWIVSTIFYVVNNGLKTSFIPRAVAETQIRNVDFTTYSNKIEALKTKLNAGYSPEVISELTMLVDGAYDHLPDRADLYKNKQLYDAIKGAIAEYSANYDAVKRSKENGTRHDDQEIILRGILQTELGRFLEEIQVYQIDSNPDATLPHGSAPHSVTFEAKQTVDNSGTLVPNENYIWWLRTGGNTQKVLGKGKTINYTFDQEGTYNVFLTINSASKNSRGFTDTISFEDSVTVEVTQPEVDFRVRINDQIADKIVKISTKEALKPIRIDASETRFSSGYTTKSTEWDFGNGNTDVNEGDPQFESQMYTPGDHTIRLKLMRNDGEEFSYSLVLKIGDPLASISTTTKTPNKGEKAVFQAKKTSNEADVQYIWEVKKQGIDATLYTFSGTRLEYIFQDTGKFFVTLTSIKGDARDKDTVEVDIESRPPNVQFTSEMISSETPNMYSFDGTSSFDPDYPDNQKLRFEWFINDTPVQLSDTNERNSRGKYTFPEKGTYRVVLRVTDEEGKSKDYKRDIKITSILSVKLVTKPEVAKRGGKVMLSVTAPRATIYEWKIGTNDPVRTENNRFITSLPTAGTFPVVVTVTDVDGDTNSATGKLYVTENDQPFSVIDIKSDSSLIVSHKSVCNGQEAITVDRANSVTFSSDRSVNKDGKNNDLTYFWKIGLNKTSTQKNVSYTFDELGCEEISLTVADKVSGASHTTQTWVRVENLAPIFSDIQVTPENDNLDIDPMKINLKIIGAKDPDGVIRSYTWYYYTDRDDQPLGFRITKTPETFFVLPKITGRYYFAVMMEDSNGLKMNTRESSDVTFSTPDLYVNTNLSTPIIENFTADTTEVKFGDMTRLSLDVRTPVSSDVSTQSEYRWDIDGDGFYDVKTTTPEYTFKYTYPGEYNPKVKVTHKGISSTKSLSLVVKNALVPKATIQMMGNKIVAYNTSSGVFQSANWYLDNKKISDNKDYLISEIEGTGAHVLKLEISDSKTTESVEYPVQSSTKNKVLIKKITRQLVVLSSLTGDATEAPDEIIWEDPMTPLALYLGESRGDIKYYVIDTDVDIDTDLSGSRDDDADNKGTASYRSGRPFQIPKGTKRETIMKIRLVGNNNQDLDSRQIRVVRKFLAVTETEDVTDSTTPKNFNLSQEDKDRIEKLRNLTQGAPEEERKEFNKILDQLGDNWYDVAERIQTLNLFSNAVNASSLSDDLKKKILEQISIVYTQGDDKIEERQLALKMITDYLAKSPKKVQIFGDSQTPGLINDIIDNPEYYDANLKIIQKIMDDYVDPDATLSDEVKQDIRDKLMILAGSPPAAQDTNTGSPTSGTPGILRIILWIVGGIMSLILGVVGLMYVRQKTANKEPVDGHQSGHGMVEENKESLISSHEETHSVGTPDWLKEDNSPFGNEDIFSEGASDTATETHQPDWLQDTTVPHDDTHKEDSKSHTDMSSTLNESSVTAPSDTIPDWLGSSTHETDSSDQDKETQIPEANPLEDHALEPAVDTAVTSETSGDIPDWLQGAEIPEKKEENDSQIQAIGEETVEDAMSQEIRDTSVQPSPEEVPAVSVSDSTEEDIPDWLKGATEETSSETVDSSIEGGENSSPTATEVSVKEEVPQNNGKKAKKETIKKKTPTKTKKQIPPSEHLLESDHDMLLPPHTTDNN